MADQFSGLDSRHACDSHAQNRSHMRFTARVSFCSRKGLLVVDHDLLKDTHRWHQIHVICDLLQYTHTEKCNLFVKKCSVVPVIYNKVKVRLHSAINWVDFVSWCMLYTYDGNKMHLWEIRRWIIHQDTKSTRLITVCKRTVALHFLPFYFLSW